jgi:hypothetical protein
LTDNSVIPVVLNPTYLPSFRALELSVDLVKALFAQLSFSVILKFLGDED